jgi:2-polyprenyl-6-methoxyphenol hydroxylase-like FAD-dependent oxidoreductase
LIVYSKVHCIARYLFMQGSARGVGPRPGWVKFSAASRAPSREGERERFVLWIVFCNGAIARGEVPQPLSHLPRGTRVGELRWQSSFHIFDRVTAREQVGRVVLAGDAAHVHAPVAARGMNLGIEDAFVFAH